MTARNWAVEGREVARRAARNREFPASARVVAGAINDVYERAAAQLLESSAPRAEELGLTVEQHHEATELKLLDLAAEAARRHLLAAPPKERKRRSRS